MKKVLVVEDDPMNMRLVFEILNSQDYVVHCAKNGEEAIRKTEKELYDLILMDIGLPKMDGIEATRIIKNMFNYKKVPIIALTAYAMKGDRERFLAAGLDDYIAKPFNIPSLIKKLENATLITEPADA